MIEREDSVEAEGGPRKGKQKKVKAIRVRTKAQKEEDERVERMMKRLLQVIGEENLEEIMMTDEMEELKQTNARLYEALQV